MPKTSEAIDQRPPLTATVAPISGLLIVDMSPSWVYGHTILQADESHEAIAQARTWERVRSLVNYLEGQVGLICLPIESRYLERICLDDLRCGRVVVCGIYGDLCVIATALRLQQTGFSPVIFRDACLWSGGLCYAVRPE